MCVLERFLNIELVLSLDKTSNVGLVLCGGVGSCFVEVLTCAMRGCQHALFGCVNLCYAGVLTCAICGGVDLCYEGVSTCAMWGYRLML